MLKFLQNHNSTVGTKEILDLLAHLHTPVVYAYILIVGIFLSILAIPCIWCLRPCNKKNLDPAKYQCCFPVEVMLFVLSGVLLIVSVASAYQIAINLQDMLVYFPSIWQNMMQDLETNICVFKSEARILICSIQSWCDLILFAVAGIPGGINDMLEQQLGPSLEEAAMKIGDIFQAETFFKRTGFAAANGTIVHAAELTVRRALDNINEIYGILGKLNYEILKDVNVTEFATNLEFPDWSVIYDDLHAIFQEFLPAAANSLFFIENLVMKTKIYSDSELYRIGNATKILQELSAEIERNVTLAITELVPYGALDSIVNASHKVDRYLNSLAIVRNSQLKIANGNFWIMLLTPTSALIASIILTFAFACAVEEIRKIVANVAWTSPSVHISVVMRSFQIFILYSLSCIWFMLILTTAFYSGYLLLSVSCKPIKDQNIFTDYVDNLSVWNNKTWLDHKLQDYLPAHNRSLKMRQVLDRCYRNYSVYMSLHMQEYWNYTEYIGKLGLVLKGGALGGKIVEVMQEMTPPNVAINFLMRKVADADKNLILEFLPSGTKSFVKLWRTIEERTLGAVKDVTWDSTARNKLLMLVEDTRQQVLFAFSNISELTDMKLHLKDMKDQLISISNLLSNFPKIFQEMKTKAIPLFFNSKSVYINTITANLKKDLQKGIELNNGSCFVLPFLYDKAEWAVCEHALLLITGTWITLGLMSVSMICSAILSCRLAGYIRGANNHYCLWRQQLENQQRYSSETARHNGTLLFDRFGNLMGRSVVTKENVN